MFNDDAPEFSGFRRTPLRSWKKEDDHSGMRCYLGMSGRITIQTILDHFAKHYPHVDPMKVKLNFATAVWDEPATNEDKARRAEERAAHAARVEKWEREQLVRLKKKYE